MWACKEDPRLRRIGINFGAPGNRTAPDGTLWFEYPVVGGPSRFLPITVEPSQCRTFLRHTSWVQGERGLKWVASSGILGIRKVCITVAPGRLVGMPYLVRLHFLEPEVASPGQRVFRVRMQGLTVIDSLDILREADGPRRPLVKEFENVLVRDELQIEFETKTGDPLLCGLKVLDPAFSLPPQPYDLTVEASTERPASIHLTWSDPDGPGPYTYRIVQPPGKGTIAGDPPELVYTPHIEARGTDTFRWIVSDGKVHSREANVTIRIAAPNVPPTAGDVRATCTENESVIITLPVTDPGDGPRPCSFSIVSEPGHGTLEWLDLGRYRYRPRHGYCGGDSFTWKAHDGADDSNLATVRIGFQPDRTAPRVLGGVALALQDKVILRFSEPMAPDTLRQPGNYTLSHALQVRTVTPTADGRSVAIGTSRLEPGIIYRLTLRGLHDLATTPNPLVEGTELQIPCITMGNGLRVTVAEGNRPPTAEEARRYTSGYMPVAGERAQVQTFRAPNDLTLEAIQLRLARAGATLPAPLIVQLRHRGTDTALATGRVTAERKDAAGRTLGVSRTYRRVTVPLACHLKRDQDYELVCISPLSPTNALWLINAFYWDAYPHGEH
ncbi:MAG: Ig-like domain-containing protein [Kiritimatiellia bacterium]